MVLHLACVSTEGPMLSHNRWSGGRRAANFRRLLAGGRGEGSVVVLDLDGWYPNKVSRTLNIPARIGAGEMAWWIQDVLQKT